MLAFMLVETEAGLREKGLVNVGEEFSKIPEVEHVYILTGIFDLLVQVRARDMDHLSELVLRKLRQVQGVSKVNTMLSMWGN